MDTRQAVRSLLGAVTVSLAWFGGGCGEQYPDMPQDPPRKAGAAAPASATGTVRLPEFVGRHFGERAIDCDRTSSRVEAVACAQESHRAARPFFIRAADIPTSSDPAWDVVPPGLASAQIALLGYAGDEKGSIFQLFHVADQGIQMQRLWTRAGGSAHSIRTGGFVTPPFLKQPFDAPHEPAWDRPALVILELTVRADGTVSYVHVLKEINGGAGAASAQLIRSRRFRPATLFGENVDSIHNFTVGVSNGRLRFPHTR